MDSNSYQYTVDALIIATLVACLIFAFSVVKKHVTFKWWVYSRAIKRSRKKEWEAYVDYYNGVTGPEAWLRLLHITELLRRRRDLERWNQWVPEDQNKKSAPAFSQKVEVRRIRPPKTSSATVRDAASWLERNTRAETPRETILSLLESYAIILDSRTYERTDDADRSI